MAAKKVTQTKKTVKKDTIKPVENKKEPDSKKETTKVVKKKKATNLYSRALKFLGF